MAFLIDKGSYGTVELDGLNLALIAHTPGPMADGNWTAAIYIDERASEQQTEALGAIFGADQLVQSISTRVGLLSPSLKRLRSSIGAAARGARPESSAAFSVAGGA